MLAPDLGLPPPELGAMNAYSSQAAQPGILLQRLGDRDPPPGRPSTPSLLAVLLLQGPGFSNLFPPLPLPFWQHESHLPERRALCPTSLAQ